MLILMKLKDKYNLSFTGIFLGKIGYVSVDNVGLCA